MKLLTLCSGIGAPEVAASWLGWEHALTCEVDPFCRQVLQYHYPNAYHHGDIKSLTKEVVENELSRRFGNRWRDGGAVLVAGFPCQPFSLAGKRGGTTDHRYLWPEVLRVVGEVRPSWFVGENVAGMLSMVLPGGEVKVGSYTDTTGESYEEVEVHEQSVVDRICIDLESVGYSVIPVVVPACAVGAPHRRDRIWFLASDSNPHGTRLQEAGTGEQATRATGIGVQRVVADTAEQGLQEWFSNGEQENGEKNKARLHDRVERHGGDGIVADADGELQECGNTSSEERRNVKGFSAESSCLQNIWKNFPTQSPVCGRDDGVSFGLSGITFPRWRQESIKALGNSMVPKVLYEFFRIIDEIENESASKNRLFYKFTKEMRTNGYRF